MRYFFRVPMAAPVSLVAGLMIIPPASADDTSVQDAFSETAARLDTTVIDLGDLVVSTSKTALPTYRLTRSVSVTTEDMMEDRQITSVLDALRQTPGVFITDQGGAGQLSSVSIRGSKYYATQFRYDDFPLRDLAATQSDFNSFIGSLMVGDGALSRIEVLKGTESTLYGTAAMGGVVSLFSHQPWGAGFDGRLRMEGGSYGTGRLSATLSYGNDGLDGSRQWYIHASPTAVSTEGYRSLWYKQTGMALGGGVRLSDDTTLELTSLTSASKNVTSILGFTPEDAGRQTAASDDNFFRYRLFLNGLTLTHASSEDWTTRLKVAYTRTERLYHGLWSSSGESGIGTDTFDGNTFYTEFLNTIKPADVLTLVTGLEYEGSRVLIRNAAGAWSPASKTSETVGNYAAFGKALFGFFDDTLNVNFGSRYSYHTEHASYTTFDAGASYLFPTRTRLYGTLASGYRAPSMYEMWGVAFGTVYGNPDLRPEKSMNYEIGLEQSLLNGRVHLGGALFWTNYRDRIAARTWADPYENIERSKVHGWELTATITPLDWAALDLGFTHARTKNRSGVYDWTLDRSIPENRAVATLTLKPTEDLTLALSGRWESSRGTTMITGYKDEAYATLDVAAAYKLNDMWEVFGRIDNLFDERYTMQAYGMPGIAAYGGLRASF